MSTAEELSCSSCFTRTFPICTFCPSEEGQKQNEHISSSQILLSFLFCTVSPHSPHSLTSLECSSAHPPLFFFLPHKHRGTFTLKKGKQNVTFLLLPSCSILLHPVLPSSDTLCLYSQGCAELSHGQTSPDTHTHTHTHTLLASFQCCSCGKDGAGAMATTSPKWALLECM